MEHALIASSDSGGSAYPPSSSSTVSSSTVQIQDVEPLSQPATAVSVKNNSVDTAHHPRMQLWRRRNLKLRSGVKLKPPKDGRAYNPNEIKLLGKRFSGKIL